MTTKRFFIYFFIMLMAAYPVSAADVSLNRWVLNVTLHDDGTVEEVIQAEIQNSGALPLEGFSFVVPASGVTVLYDFDHTSSFSGQVVEQQAVPGGTKIIVNFNSSVEAGKKWDGRIGFTAQNWAVKEGTNYSIDIPLEAPRAVASGKDTPMSVSPDAEIRSQVFLPKGVTATSVEPSVDVASKRPAYKKLLQFDHVVLTWFQLHIGDTISVKGSFSSVLNKIVETDERWRVLEAAINKAKAGGMNVSEAETHLNNAEDYNTNQALQSYWKNDNKVALEYVGYANDELNQTEKSLSSTRTGSPEETGGKKSPGFGVAGLMLALLVYFVVKRK